LITAATFSPILRQELTTWDDPVYVTLNPFVTGGLTRIGIQWAFTTFEQANYHPLTWLSLMVDAEISGNQAWGYKLTNLLLHLASTLLIMFIFYRSTGQQWPSLLVAALFALHPLHVESVAWVSERKDTLSTTFVLAAIACYIIYARGRQRTWYVAFLGTYVLSLLAKQMYVTLPALLLLLDIWPLRRWNPFSTRSSSETSTRPLTALLAEKLPPLTLAFAAAFLIFRLQAVEGNAKHAEFSLLERLGNAVVGYTAYLEKTFLPTELIFFYPFPDDGYTSRQIAVAAAILIAISIASLALIRVAPFFFVGWFWYLGTLVPVIGLVQVGFQAYADRYTYFPLIGLFAAVVWSLVGLTSRRPIARGVAGLLAGATVAALSFQSYNQVLTWNNSKAMALYAWNIDPKNHQANAILGYIASQEFRWEEAETYLTAAVEAKVAPPTHQLNLGIVLLCRGKVEQAREHFEIMQAANLPRESNIKYQLGLMAAGEKRWDEAQRLLGEAQAINPNLAQSLAIAVVQAHAGKVETAAATLASLPSGPAEIRLANELVGKMAKGNAEAKRRFERIFDWPVDIQASRMLAGNVDNAVTAGIITRTVALEQLRRSLKIWPYNLDALLQMAKLLGQSKRDAEAKSMLFRILEIDPRHVQANQALGRRPPADDT
jgi:tetratricopeptide (TPR) repeat protein